MTTCAACSAPLRDGAKFCGACGAAIVVEGCAACGAPLRPGAKFCGACGAAAHRFDSTVLWVVPHDATLALVEAVGGAVLRVRHESALDEVQAAIRAHDTLEAVCLVGDHDALPFARLDDPCGFDEALWTDAPYGMPHTPTATERFAGDLLPTIPVSRLPTADAAQVRRLLAGAPLCGHWRGGLGVAAEVWREAAGAVLDAVGGKAPLLSPPGERAQVEAALGARPGRLYFNVHGTEQEAAWYGEGDGRFPEVLRAPGVRVADDAVVVSEACYGAMLGTDAIAPTFLGEGAGCFLGSTIIAWGSPRHGPPTMADHLAQYFFRALDEGVPSAAALQRARLELLAAGGGMSAPLHNTLLSFVVYGPPQRAGERAPGAALRAAREALRQRLAPDAWEVLSSGRVRLSALAAQVRGGDAVARHVEALLGVPATDARLVRYRTPAGEQASVFATARSGPLVRRAGADVDAQGRVVRSFVSR